PASYRGAVAKRRLFVGKRHSDGRGSGDIFALMHRVTWAIAMVWLVPATSVFAALPPLHAQGTRMVDPSGKPVVLRGSNLGNWLMIETWMLGGTINAKDQGEITDILRQRFDDERGYRLVELYREHYITPRDFELVKS